MSNCDVRRLLFVWVGILFFSTQVASAPIIQSASGELNHGSTITLTGSGFGTDSNAIPRIWDNGTANNVLDIWDARYPNSNTSEYIMDYRTPQEITKASGSAPGLPHPYVNKYLSGAHYNPTTNGANQNYNVGVTTANIGTDAYSYISFYYRADPDWYDSGGDDNHKMYSYAAGTSMYPSGNFFYFSAYSFDLPGMGISPNYVTGRPPLFSQCDDVRAVDGALINWYSNKPGGNGSVIGSCNMFPKTSGSNPKSDWVKLEFIMKHGDNSIGVHHIRQDNERRWYVELNDDVVERSTTTRSESIGGYSRDYGTSNVNKNNWRYFSDVYYSNSWSRVMMANESNYANASVTEPQILTSWTNNRIDMSVNIGRLDITRPLYVFVVDKNGVRSSEGYELVNLGVPQPGIAPPNPPTPQ